MPKSGIKKWKESVTFEKKKKINTGCLRGILYFVIIVSVSVGLAVFVWGCANDVLALQKPEGEVKVTIPEGFTIPELSRMLADKGVIEKPWLFTFYCSQSGAEKLIQPNTPEQPEYTIRKNLDYHALIYSFRIARRREEVWIRIDEGNTYMETLRQITESGVSDLPSLIEAERELRLEYDFLEGLQQGDGRLEGYLYPDTYLFFTDASPRSVLTKFMDNFNQKYAPSMRTRVANMEYTLHEILTIASLIEKEAAAIDEMKRVASVIYNRLEDWNEPLLQIDATGVYLLGEKENLTQADIYEARSIDSPYNTFLYPGLPPGPICSPGLEAIRAALYPEENTSYYYYALGKDERHHFFQNERAFNNFINSDQFYYN